MIMTIDINDKGIKGPLGLKAITDINNLGPCLAIIDEKFKYDKCNRLIEELENAWAENQLDFEVYVKAKSKLGADIMNAMRIKNIHENMRY